MGDHVIKDVVNIISSRTRKLDSLFRIGGEEFTLLMPLSSGYDAKKLANELKAKIANTKLIGGRQVTVSIGVSELEPKLTAGDWVKQSDLSRFTKQKEPVATVSYGGSKLQIQWMIQIKPTKFS